MKRILLLSTVFFYALTRGYGQAGNLDSSFGTRGIVKSDVGNQFYHYSFVNQVSKILLANDGSIFNVISTSFGRSIISKWHQDGTIDLSYGNKGFSNFGVINVNDAVMQPNGKIILVGYNQNRDFTIARYNTDGTLDKTFSDNGYQATVFGSVKSLAYSVALQSDGKIMVGGISGDLQAGFTGDFTLARYNSNGNLDSSFSSDGKQTTSFGNSGSALKSILIQKDGKIIAAGSITVTAGGPRVFALARYNSNGDLDNSFGDEGKQTTALGSQNAATTAAIQADGKIILAGNLFSNTANRYQACLVRYHTNGSLDNTFDGDGSVITDYGSGYYTSQTIALQSDGKIVLAHSISTSNGLDFAVSRYTVTGGLDNTFSGDGTQVADFSHTANSARAVAIQNDGKILVGGGTSVSQAPAQNPAVCRFKSDGTPDNSFDTNGKMTYSLTRGYTEFRATTVQKDGKVIAAGFTFDGSGFDFVVVRYNTNGTLDHSFSGDGIQTTSFDPSGAGADFGSAVAIHSDGKIVVAGSHSNGDVEAFAVARYNTDGTPDKNFDDDGKKIIVFGPDFANYATSVVIQKNGKIVAGGTYNEKSALIRLNAGGTLDKTFSDNGKQLADFPGSPYSIINSIALQSNGKIVTAGHTFTGGLFTLARFNTDGTPDESFGNHGKDTGSFNAGTSVAIQSDDKILLTGSRVVRFTRDGQPDLTFNGTGISELNGVSSANAVAIGQNGKIFVGGTNGGHSAVAAINSNGTLDHNFGDNGKKILTVGLGGNDNTVGLENIYAVAIFNNNLYAAGTASVPGHVGTVLKFLLSSSGVAPAITLNKINSLNAPAINNVAFTLRVFPNPLHDILNVYTDGLQESKQQTITIISASGVIIQTKQAGTSSGQIPLNVSSLARGTYTIKIVSGEKVICKQFVKL